MRCEVSVGAEEAENGCCPRQDSTAAWPHGVEREHTPPAGVMNPPGGDDGGGHPLLNYHRRGGRQRKEHGRKKDEEKKRGSCEEVDKKTERTEEVEM